MRDGKRQNGPTAAQRQAARARRRDEERAAAERVAEELARVDAANGKAPARQPQGNRKPAEDPFTKALNRIQQLAREVEEQLPEEADQVLQLLLNAKCPSCGGTGEIIRSYYPDPPGAGRHPAEGRAMVVAGSTCSDCGGTGHPPLEKTVRDAEDLVARLHRRRKERWWCTHAIMESRRTEGRCMACGRRLSLRERWRRQRQHEGCTDFVLGDHPRDCREWERYRDEC